jgi:hypothetical protein
MKQWWVHNTKYLPTLDAEEKIRLEDLTGCIPLLLRPLFELKDKKFNEIERNILESKDLVNVSINIHNFSGRSSSMADYEK